MHVLGKERNEGGIGHERESHGGRGGEHGGLVVEEKERAFARACGFHDSGQYEARSFRELALSRERWPELGKSFDRMQQPP
jgi:hypothetical protein